ncbi:MAG: PatB family C-S lyase, partial [Pseudomonadota bacterium]|nr:PatB family C-S lyase [Pseudomonadota bacterium]
MSDRFDEIIDRQHTSTVKFDARKAVFGTDDVIPLWVADMDFSSPPEVIEAIKTRVDHGVFGYAVYPDSLYESQIDWCQQRFDWAISKQQMVMCPGVVPSLVAAISALTSPGDQVIVQSPVYFPFFSAVTEIGRELVLNPLKETDGHYEIDFAHLEQCAQAGAKILLFCSPHNPVGRVWTEAELHTLLALAERHGLTIISDEIHGDLILPGYQHLPLATLTDKVNVITAMAPTKTFNIAGLILSSLIIPKCADKKAIEAVL